MLAGVSNAAGVSRRCEYLRAGNTSFYPSAGPIPALQSHDFWNAAFPFLTGCRVASGRSAACNLCWLKPRNIHGSGINCSTTITLKERVPWWDVNSGI